MTLVEIARILDRSFGLTASHREIRNDMRLHKLRCATITRGDIAQMSGRLFRQQQAAIAPQSEAEARISEIAARYGVSR